MAQRVLGDRYELRSLLGRGGMAEVWQGFDRRLGRMVAVKVLLHAEAADPSWPARFDREARTAAGLSHPNIVAVHDVGADHGIPYLVMELVQGRSLAQRLAEGPLDLAAAVRVAIQVSAALEAAAAAGVVHRDVKPANILITDAGQVKVCDFGIARAAGAARGELTGTAQIIGTSAYMAPEQVTGGPIDARTDLYGLGCVLYAMVTGRPPFSGDNPMQIAWQHVESTPAPVSTLRPGVPAELDRLIQALLAKYPADRPATPGQARAALEALSLGAAPAGPVLPPTAAMPAPTRTMPVPLGDGRPPRSRRVVPAAVAVAALAAVAAIVLTMRSGEPEPQARPTASAAAPTTEATTTSPTVVEPPRADRDTRSVIAAQVRAGNLEEKDARDLNKRLDKIEKEAAGGDGEKVVERVSDLREKLDDLRDDGRLSDAGYDAILASLPAGGED